MGGTNRRRHSKNWDSLGAFKKLQNPKSKLASNNPLTKESFAETLLIVTIDHLLEEVKKLLITLSERKKDKEESVRLFQTLLSHYHPLIGTNYNDIISLFILDACINHYPIQLSFNEIRSWLPIK
jgi:hypothetical protein